MHFFCFQLITSQELSIVNSFEVVNHTPARTIPWCQCCSIVFHLVIAHVNFQILRIVPHSYVGSDLSGTNLEPLSKPLVVGRFNARWKSNDDPTNYGQALVGLQSAYLVEYIETKLKWLSCLFISHFDLKSQEWAKNDLHPLMKVYMKSGTNVLIFAFIFCILHVIIVSTFEL